MSLWLTLTLAAAIVIVVPVVRALIMRALRRRQPRTIEQPNSFYTPKLVLDRDSRDRWRGIPLERVNEINRGEVRRLVERVEALGVDCLNERERIFLDRMVELYPPMQPARSEMPHPSEDPFWADPFGFERRLGTRDAK
jgi:hypothetical protein